MGTSQLALTPKPPGAHFYTTRRQLDKPGRSTGVDHGMQQSQSRVLIWNVNPCIMEQNTSQII